MNKDASQGGTPLSPVDHALALAVSHDWRDDVQTLLAWGANPCVNNHIFLVMACLWYCDHAAKLLLDAGTDPNARGGEAYRVAKARSRPDVIALMEAKMVASASGHGPTLIGRGESPRSHATRIHGVEALTSRGAV